MNSTVALVFVMRLCSLICHVKIIVSKCYSVYFLCPVFVIDAAHDKKNSRWLNYYFLGLFLAVQTLARAKVSVLLGQPLQSLLKSSTNTVVLSVRNCCFQTSSTLTLKSHQTVINYRQKLLKSS